MASGGGGARQSGARRGKVKKRTKYLSLSRHLAKAEDLECSPPSALASPSSVEMGEDGGDGGGHEQQQQLEAFALHPEAPSTLFAAAPSLIDILGASSSSSAGGGGGGEGSSSCGASPDDAPGGTGEEEDLARRALRGRERWVYCRSSSSSPLSAATTTTTTSSSCSSAASTGGSARSPLLKLDYDEILAAWAGRGSLYIGGAAAGRAAPELELDSVFVEVGPSTRHRHVAAAWSAPEKVAGRAERVRRYREKRQGRLFQKRIRYEVRRINAVQRPRLKGRFIKEKEGAAMADGTELQPS